jgi:hypothetical protein
MPWRSQKDVLNLKLNTIPLEQLKKLTRQFSLDDKGSSAEIIKRIFEITPDEQIIDAFIKDEYSKKIQKRRQIISDEDLKNELRKVNSFSWGVVQGQLDQKIQSQYVRKIVTYESLLDNVKAQLHDEVTSYTICTWFNHWTTVLIEEHISAHKRVIPTIKNIKGVDIFFDGQPFDLKVTYLPHNYNSIDVIENPQKLAVWMYENQGAQRFGADNRLFVVLLDKNNPDLSWELKRDFDLVFNRIDDFFHRETVSLDDEIVFTFNKETYPAVSKVVLVTK